MEELIQLIEQLRLKLQENGKINQTTNNSLEETRNIVQPSAPVLVDIQSGAPEEGEGQVQPNAPEEQDDQVHTSAPEEEMTAVQPSAPVLVDIQSGAPEERVGQVHPDTPENQEVANRKTSAAIILEVLSRAQAHQKHYHQVITKLLEEWYIQPKAPEEQGDQVHTSAPEEQMTIVQPNAPEEQDGQVHTSALEEEMVNVQPSASTSEQPAYGIHISDSTMAPVGITYSMNTSSSKFDRYREDEDSDDDEDDWIYSDGETSPTSNWSDPPGEIEYSLTYIFEMGEDCEPDLTLTQWNDTTVQSTTASYVQNIQLESDASDTGGYDSEDEYNQNPDQLPSHEVLLRLLVADMKEPSELPAYGIHISDSTVAPVGITYSTNTSSSKFDRYREEEDSDDDEDEWIYSHGEMSPTFNLSEAMSREAQETTMLITEEDTSQPTQQRKPLSHSRENEIPAKWLEEMSDKTPEVTSQNAPMEVTLTTSETLAISQVRETEMVKTKETPPVTTEVTLQKDNEEEQVTPGVTATSLPKISDMDELEPFGVLRPGDKIYGSRDEDQEVTTPKGSPKVTKSPTKTPSHVFNREKQKVTKYTGLAICIRKHRKDEAVEWYMQLGESKKIIGDPPLIPYTPDTAMEGQRDPLIHRAFYRVGAEQCDGEWKMKKHELAEKKHFSGEVCRINATREILAVIRDTPETTGAMKTLKCKGAIVKINAADGRRTELKVGSIVAGLMTTVASSDPYQPIDNAVKAIYLWEAIPRTVRIVSRACSVVTEMVQGRMHHGENKVSVQLEPATSKPNNKGLTCTLPQSVIRRNPEVEDWKNGQLITCELVDGKVTSIDKVCTAGEESLAHPPDMKDKASWKQFTQMLPMMNYTLGYGGNLLTKESRQDFEDYVETWLHSQQAGLAQGESLSSTDADNKEKLFQCLEHCHEQDEMERLMASGNEHDQIKVFEMARYRWLYYELRKKQIETEKNSFEKDQFDMQIMTFKEWDYSIPSATMKLQVQERDMLPSKGTQVSMKGTTSGISVQGTITDDRRIAFRMKQARNCAKDSSECSWKTSMRNDNKFEMSYTKTNQGGLAQNKLLTFYRRLANRDDQLRVIVNHLYFGETLPTKTGVVFKNDNFPQMTTEQQRSCDLYHSGNPVVVTVGHPGSGKSIVSLGHAVKGMDQNKRSLMVTPTNINKDNLAEKCLEIQKRGAQFTAMTVGAAESHSDWRQLPELASPQIMWSIWSKSTNKAEHQTPTERLWHRMPPEIQKHLTKWAAGQNLPEKNNNHDELMRLIEDQIAVDNSFQMVRQWLCGEVSILIATTHWVMKEAFSTLTFNNLIIDESGSTPDEDTCTVLTLMSPKDGQLSLVGDERQLGSMVKSGNRMSYKAQKYQEEVAVTILERIMQNRPPGIKIVELTVHHRSSTALVEFSNAKFYNGRICSKAARYQELPLGMTTTHPIKFYDTTVCRGSSNETTRSIENIGEAKVVGKIVEKLLAAGISSKQIFIISFYKAQVRHLQNFLPTGAEDTEVATIDQSQGNECDFVLISLAKSEGSIGFMTDPKRINVSLTRSKVATIVFGARGYLETHSPLWRDFIAHLPSKAIFKVKDKGMGKQKNMQQ